MITESKIYTLTANGLQPLIVDGCVIGQRVKQAHRGEVGTICAKAACGYLVIFDDGEYSDSQTVGALSPFTRITPVEPVEIVNDARISELINLKAAVIERKRIAANEAAEQKKIDTERIVADLRKRYPWAVPAGNLSGHARAAKNIKAELTRAFPGVKFSVRSDSFSGGNSVDVSWPLGPSGKAVDAILNKYEYGSFDGMTDSYDYDHSAYGDAVSIVLGRAKYVHGQRETHSIHEAVERALCELQHVEYAGSYTDIMKSGGWGNETAQSQANQLISVTEFPVNFDGQFTIEHDDRDDRPHWCKIVFPAPETDMSGTDYTTLGDVLNPTDTGDVQVTENDEKNGVEIRFACKPSDDVRDSLKFHGFRWSRFQSLWYARRTPETLSFARSLVAQ